MWPQQLLFEYHSNTCTHIANTTHNQVCILISFSVQVQTALSHAVQPCSKTQVVLIKQCAPLLMLGDISAYIQQKMKQLS
jgi:hypothetical protein